MKTNFDVLLDPVFHGKKYVSFAEYFLTIEIICLKLDQYFLLNILVELYTWMNGVVQMTSSKGVGGIVWQCP